MRSSLLAFILVLGIACNRPTLERDIVGVWISEGVPTSAALPEKLRSSADWEASLEFRPDGSFTWNLDNAEGGEDRFTGLYSVVGYSLEIELTSANGRELSGRDRLQYRVRQQGTGSIRLPLPQDWTGPSVDYYRKN